MKILCTKEEFRRIIVACENDGNNCSCGCALFNICPYNRIDDNTEQEPGDWLSSICEIVSEEVSGND